MAVEPAMLLWMYSGRTFKAMMTVLLHFELVSHTKKLQHFLLRKSKYLKLYLFMSSYFCLCVFSHLKVLSLTFGEICLVAFLRYQELDEKLYMTLMCVR